jgi:L-threonylcarbamoyladenylate synthase
MTPEEIAAFERCIEGGGVVLFPADTVYGLAVDPDSREAVERLYALKGRAPDRPAAVMLFDLTAFPELGPRTRAALERLLPGPLTVLLPNPERRWPLACGPSPERLGLRVPDIAGPSQPILQSSANPSGGPDPRRLADVDERIRAGADLAIDGGELPGTASTVVDLTRYEEGGEFEVGREGAVPTDRVAAMLALPRPR